MTDPSAPPSQPVAPRGAPPRRLIILIVLAGILVIAIIVVIVLLLMRGGGASPDASGAPTTPPSSTTAPTGTATPTPTAAPTAPPVAAPFVMPPCSAMAVPDIPPRVAAGEWVEITTDGDQAGMAQAMPGPVAAAAVTASPQVRECVWGPPASESAAIVWAAEMSQEQWDAFAAQLAAGGWTPVDVDGAPGFSQLTGEPAMNGPAEWWYVYDRGAWLTFPFESSPEVRSAALAGVRAANP